MYDIVEVTADEGPLEPMGSKPKFWFEHPEWGPCLFKAARPGSGEDWSEKLAEQFADHLGIPHARYEMARYQGENGIITPRITQDDERLVHGNELLIELDPEYAEGSTGYRTPLHTVDAVFNALEESGVAPPSGHLIDGVETCGHVLTGFLLLDALIGNTDRHHENWAVVEDLTESETASPLRLCPTFDHASSLGRNEPIERMEARLHTADDGFTVEAYASRARSALYSEVDADRPLSPLSAFSRAKARANEGAQAWCGRLDSLTTEAIRSIVEDVPAERMPETAKQFVVRMVCFNKKHLEEECRSQ